MQIAEIMVKKEKKSKSAEQKARVAAKQTRKSAQKEKKARSKAADGSDAEDVDLESVLEEYARQVITINSLPPRFEFVPLKILMAHLYPTLPWPHSRRATIWTYHLL